MQFHNLLLKPGFSVTGIVFSDFKRPMYVFILGTGCVDLSREFRFQANNMIKSRIVINKVRIVNSVSKYIRMILVNST